MACGSFVLLNKKGEPFTVNGQRVKKYLADEKIPEATIAYLDNVKKFEELVETRTAILPAKRKATVPVSPTKAKIQKKVPRTAILSSATTRAQPKAPRVMEEAFVIEGIIDATHPDPGPLFLKCSINGRKFDKCLIDCGASTNVMPWALAEELGFQVEIDEDLGLRIGDQSVISECGRLEDVQIEISNVIVLTNFTVIRMAEESYYDFVIGRPFLKATNALIDQGGGAVALTLGDIKMVTSNRIGQFSYPIPKADLNYIDPDLVEDYQALTISKVNQELHMLKAENANQPAPSQPITIGCNINKRWFPNCLVDPDALSNTMSWKLAESLGLEIHQDGEKGLTLANQIDVIGCGLIKNVEVKISMITMLTDFLVINMNENSGFDFTFGRPFLKTTKAEIDQDNGTITLQLGIYKRVTSVNPATRAARTQARASASSSTFQQDQAKPSSKVPSPHHEACAITSEGPSGHQGRRTARMRATRQRTPILRTGDDPGVPYITCRIREGTFRKCMCDTGANINIMPLHLAHFLGYFEFEIDDETLQMANTSRVQPHGMLRNVLVHVGGSIVVTNFVVMNMVNATAHDILLGRPFLRTVGAEISAATSTVVLHLGGNSVVFVQGDEEPESSEPEEDPEEPSYDSSSSPHY